MPPISHPPPTWRRLVAAAAFSALFFFLLLPTPLPSAAAQPASTPPSDESSFSTRAQGPFDPSVATGVMFVAIFFLVFLSAYAAYVLHCSPAPEGSIGRAVHSLRSLAAPLGLEPAVVETFPTVVYSAVKVHKSGVAPLECAVCLNDFEDDDTLRLLPKCDHAFHPDCIGAWLASHTTCPVCRADLALQPAGDSEGQQAEPDAETLPVEGTPPDAGAPEGSQREGEREGNQPPDLGDTSESGSFSNTNRTRGGSRMRGFSRSHSTGHSLVRPGEDTERFTLRLPAEVRKQLMDRPGPVLPPECCSRRGYRCGGEGSSRGRYFRWREWQDRPVKSERWAFNFFVRLSPRVAVDGGSGGSSRGSVQQARPAI